jgi:hypothetical protein
MDDITPLGITQIYDPTTNTTQVSWSYREDANIDYFVLEYWDENKNMWVPYDGKLGIVKAE